MFKSIILFFLSFQLQAQTYIFTKAETKTKNNPILVFVHGGAWIGGRAENANDLMAAFAKSGVCAASINYRLAPQSQNPAPIEDLDIAIKKIIVSNSKSDCDTNRIYLIGHSAGAHTIAMWAAKNKLKKVRGFIGLSGIYDIPLVVKMRPEYEQQFITSEFGAAAKWPAASPSQAAFENKAHWLLVQSKKDELVDLQQTELFKKHLEEKAIKVAEIILENESHFGVLQAASEQKTDLFKKILAFVKN